MSADGLCIVCRDVLIQRAYEAKKRFEKRQTCGSKYCMHTVQIAQARQMWAVRRGDKLTEWAEEEPHDLWIMKKLTDYVYPKPVSPLLIQCN